MLKYLICDSCEEMNKKIIADSKNLEYLTNVMQVKPELAFMLYEDLKIIEENSNFGKNDAYLKNSHIINGITVNKKKNYNMKIPK